MKVETLAIVYQPPRVLLAMKKRGFGEGKWNGFGGKLQEGEALEDCVVRETREEGGITLINPELVGKVRFIFLDGDEDHLAYFYRATEYEGTPRETEEMKPEWFDADKLPYDQMWPDDKHWMPLLLQKRKFDGRFGFMGKDIEFFELNEVEKIEI